jgi:hypothetical protein
VNHPREVMKRARAAYKLVSMPTRALTLVALALAASLGACGSSGKSVDTTTTATSTTTAARTVDTATVEQQIQQQLSTSDVKVTNVNCPSNVKVQKGATFTCTVYFSNNGGGKVQVTQQGGGHYTYVLEPGSVTVPGSWVDGQLEQALAKEGISGATVTCPATIVVKVGTTVTCNVTGKNGVKGQVTFQFTNANGSVDTSSVSES